MKNFNDLTDLEISELTSEEIERYVDYECAMEGIQLLPPHPGNPPEKVEAEKDTEIYTVGEFVFLSKESALKFFDFVTENGFYRIEGYQENRRVILANPEDYYYPKMSSEMIASEQSYAKSKQQLDIYKTEKKRYDAIKERYDNAKKERQGILDGILDKIQEAVTRIKEQKQLRTIFNRYIDLADGNRETALKFLLNANSDASELYPDLVKELSGDNNTQIKENAEEENA